MTVHRLESGYWHVRYGWHRFAQWEVGKIPSADDFFGDWSKVERAQAFSLVCRVENCR